MDCIRYTKITLAIISALSLTIIVATMSNQIPIGVIIASLICLYCVCGIVIFDNSSIIRLLKIQVDRLESENHRLTQLVDTLHTNVENLTTENDRYKGLNDQQTKSLVRLDKQLTDNKTIIETGKKQLEEFRMMLVKASEINEINNRLIISQKDNITKLSQQLDIATTNNTNLALQVQKFETLNGGLKTIISTMARTIDQSSNLETELSNSINKVQAVSHDILESSRIMDQIINGLSHLKFEQLDIDNNGEISKSEWQKMVLVDDYHPKN